ncbi:hypothetical protein GW932_00365 [archaeon]|nr:hypothetical protein [archaeon]
MTRRNILEVTQEIYTLLKKEKELSIKSISDKIGSQWRTTLKSLEMLKEINVVREKKGKKLNKEERLFFLTEKKSEYNK